MQYIQTQAGLLINEDGDKLFTAKQLIDGQFSKEDRIDSASIQQEHDGTTVLIVNANMGNVGSGTCEFAWVL